MLCIRVNSVLKCMYLLVSLCVFTLVCDAVFEIDDVDVFDSTDFGELGHEAFNNTGNVVFEFEVVFLLLLFGVDIGGVGVAVNKELINGQDIVLGDLQSSRILTARKAHR